MPAKEFVICDHTVMVRETKRVERSYSITGRDLGWSVSVTLRPADAEEVLEYQRTNLKLIREVPND